MAFNANIHTDKETLTNEYALFGKILPYVAMAAGAGLSFALSIIIRLSIWLHASAGHGSVVHDSVMMTFFYIFSMIALAVWAHIAFGQRNGNLGDIHIAKHGVITTVAIHLWLILSLWENLGHAFFGFTSLTLFFLGAVFLAVTWVIRRFGFRPDASKAVVQQRNPYGEIGLGETTVATGATAIPGGKKIALELELGKTVKAVHEKREELAQIFRVNSARLRTQGDKEDPTKAYITVMDEMPFARINMWTGPFRPGTSIAEPIEFATYDTGGRPQLYIGGKNGGSTQHYLTAGMSGSGKSYGWQSIYGSVLNRSEVSVLYADPAKGLQTVKPLLSGIEWFADGVEESLEMFEGVERAIKARGTYLAKQDLENWVPGCGINLLILHIEEAARFMSDPEVSKEDLSRMTRIIAEARSAGIVVVYSLQRITHDCIPTSLRYNLGGTLCFGLKSAADTKIVLGNSTALPHTLKDNFPGVFYLEARGLNQDMVGNQLKTDTLDRRVLEQAVIEGAQYRTPMDNVTASALGSNYSAYRSRVAVKPAVSHSEATLIQTGTSIGQTNKAAHFNSDPEVEKARLWNIVETMKANGEDFITAKDMIEVSEKGKSSVYKILSEWVIEEKIVKTEGGYNIM